MLSIFNIVIEFEYRPQKWVINSIKYDDYFYLILSRKIRLQQYFILLTLFMPLAKQLEIGFMQWNNKLNQLK